MMLMVALQGVVCTLGGSYPAVEQYLRYLGTRHRKVGIPPELFPKFCDMLVATVAEYLGEAWDEELEGQWRTALAGATAIMLEGYGQDHYVFQMGLLAIKRTLATGQENPNSSPALRSILSQA